MCYEGTMKGYIKMYEGVDHMSGYANIICESVSMLLLARS